MGAPLTLGDLAAAFALGLICAGLLAVRHHRRFRRRQHFDLTAICRRSFDNGWLSAGGDPARVFAETTIRPEVQAAYFNTLPLDLPDHLADLPNVGPPGMTLRWPVPGCHRRSARAE